ncbi:6-O-methylguanine DNA methyltransferase [Crassisporium funariophilum]|nr:6-O-methylguanine DNA methyltransferase [Crassisporium funariophilum]
MPVQRSTINVVTPSIHRMSLLPGAINMQRSLHSPNVTIYEPVAVVNIQDVVVNKEESKSKEIVSSTTVTATYYPLNDEERISYRTQAGKRLTPHQWAVYDFALTIPSGKVVTYKNVALSAGGSPRSVGSALRNNPFAPYVPCHRVIASNLFIGGFFGEWGKDDKTGTRCNQKIEYSGSGRCPFYFEWPSKGLRSCFMETLITQTSRTPHRHLFYIWMHLIPYMPQEFIGRIVLRYELTIHF